METSPPTYMNRDYTKYDMREFQCLCSTLDLSFANMRQMHKEKTPARIKNTMLKTMYGTFTDPAPFARHD